MLIDFRAEEGLETSGIVPDVCVIGAGIAGIGLVRRLLGTGRKILLLESGGADYEPEVAGLNSGTNSGLPYYELEDSRLRLFGGTAAIWGGRCAELDEIDFEPREWVRYSGWPFAKDALRPYYADARKLLQLSGRPLDARLWSELGAEPPHFGTGVLATDFWQFDDAWDRFGIMANRDLVEHPDLLICLHASVVAINLNESDRRSTAWK